MDSTRKSKRSSEENDDTFWKTFLSPLLNKEKFTQYDPDFEKSPKLQELERKPFNPNTSLSGSVLEKLLEQKQTVEGDKEKKVRKLMFDLSQLVNVSKFDSQATEGNLHGQAHGSSTNESQANAVSMEFGSTPDIEAASRDEETVIIDSDDEEVEVTRQAKRMKTEDVKEDVKEEEQNAEPLSKEQEANVAEVLRLVRELDRIKRGKSHQQLNASDWTMKTLQIYIKRDKVQLVETLVSGTDSASGSQELHNDRFSSLKNSLVMRSRQLLDNHQHFGLDEDKGLKLWSFQFAEPLIKEPIVSFMVLDIIGAACDLCDCRMKPEEVLEKNEFPGSRVDYALAHKGIIFGIVEVKTPKSMNDKAVAQLMISLLKLQFPHNDARMQYIGILTDGFRFVLVSLQGDKFTFESTMNMGIPEIKIYTAVTWENLFQLCEYLQSVLSSVTANLPNIAKKISSP